MASCAIRRLHFAFVESRLGDWRRAYTFGIKTQCHCSSRHHGCDRNRWCPVRRLQGCRRSEPYRRQSWAGHPYAFKSKEEYQAEAAKLRSEIAALAPPEGGRAIPMNDFIVHGSAAYYPGAVDVDFAIRVSPQDFNALLEQSFRKEVAAVRARGVDPFTMKMADATNADQKTLAHAVQVGKITAGRAKPRLRSARDNASRSMGIEIDLSIIKFGGEFDVEPTLQVP